MSRLPKRVATRADLLRRDLGMVARTLRGHRPSPVVRDRQIQRYDASAGAVSLGGKRPLQVEEVIFETSDAISLTLSDPTGRYVRGRPGQFLTLFVPHEGEVHRRAYSLSARPIDGPVQITIKRVDGGLVSNLIGDWGRAEELKGRTFEVRGPSGGFIAESRPEEPRRLVLVAGGSGITPMRAILEDILAIEDDARVALVYGNRSDPDVIFADVLRELASKNPDRFRLVEVLETPPEGWEGLTGVMDTAIMTEALDLLAPWLEGEGHISYMLCGPEPVRVCVRALLDARGVSGDRIAEERFVSPGARATAAEGGSHEVILRGGGGEISFMTIPGRTVLEAAGQADVALPFSCTMGGCGACGLRLARGEVRLAEPHCLTDEERDEGRILTCVATALGPLELEVG